ncbi:hypothetical protein Tco_1539630 [Tanacetum coccineum]
MDDSNATMEEYIEEEKAQKPIAFNDEVSSKTLSCEPMVSSLNDEIDFRISFDDSDDEDYTDRGSKEISTNIGGEFINLEILKCSSLETSRRLFNTILLRNSTWRIYYIHDLISVETKFPAIAFDDEVSSNTLSCEPMVSSLNEEIDFRISFDDFDNEDYTPTIGRFDDLGFFKDFENEFPAIVYNDAPTSKSDLLTKPIFNPQHIDEFDLNDETSFYEYDEEEQNVWYFNDLFPFNIIHPGDLKSEKDNNDNEIDIIQSTGGQEEYVVVKEDEYDDLTITSDEACRAYQEIFRIMDEGWMVTRTE